MSDWYGHEIPDLDEEQRTISAAVRWALKGDAGQRAIIAWHMGWEPARTASGADWLLPYIVVHSNDPYHAVRYLSHRASLLHKEFDGNRTDFMSTDYERRAYFTRLAFDKWAETAVRTVRHYGPALLIDERTRRFDEDAASAMMLQNENKRMTLNE